MRWRRRLPEIALVVSAVASFLAVWPIGEYAVDDDWAFVRSLEILHDTGRMRILDWNPMTLVSHLVWGLAFTKVLGFGFTVAKLSMLPLVLIEGAALIGLLRLARARESLIVVAVLALVLDPLHCFHAALYVTDVPASAWTMLALLLYARGLAAPRGRDRAWLVAGGVAAAIAWGVRQNTVLVVAAVGAYLLLADRERRRDPLVWLTAIGIPVAAAAAFSWWYFAVHGATEAYATARVDIAAYWARASLRGTTWTAYSVLAYLAFFALPLLAAVPWRLLRPARAGARRRAWIAAGVLGAVFVWMTAEGGLLFPYMRNKLTQFGFLSPNEVIVGAREVLWTRAVGLPFSVLLLAGVVGLAFVALGGPRSHRETGTGAARLVTLRLAALLLALQLVYVFAAMGILFDRHLLMLLPVLLVLVVAMLGPDVRPRAVPAALLLALYGGYGVAATHDVHAFSRTAFAVGRAIADDGVDVALIDAGVAFDGWHMFERSRREMRQEGLPPRTRRWDPWYLGVIAPRILSLYVVSLSPETAPETWIDGLAPWARVYTLDPRLDGRRVLRAFPYVTYWPPGTRHVYVLRDETLSAPPPAPP